MRKLALILAMLASNAAAQTLLPRVTPDDLEKHIIKKHQPVYPGFAQFTHITGPVQLEIRIDSTGNTTVWRVIQGHPLLVDPAVAAVKQWKFRPFLVEGKPAAVMATVVLRFATNEEQNAEADAVEAFHYNFWHAAYLAQAAMAKGDFANAAEQLKRAEDFLKSVREEVLHDREQIEWLNDTGDVEKAQKKYDEAEKSYQQALAQQLKMDKDAPEAGNILKKLATLYAEQKRYELARDYLGRSVGVYENNFKKAKRGDLEARQTYGERVANGSFVLSQIETELKNYPEAVKRCQAVLEFQAYLSAANHDALVRACEKKIQERQ